MMSRMMESAPVKDAAAAVDEIKIALQSAKAARRQFGDGVKTIRNYIQKLKAEKEAVLALCVGEDVAKQRAAEWVKGFRENYGASQMRPDTFARREFSRPMPVDIPAIFVECLDKILTSALHEKIAEFYRDTPSISGEERAAQLAVIERKILDAELAEESLIRSAWSAGFTVHRRRNAHPWAVMAADSALP